MFSTSSKHRHSADIHLLRSGEFELVDAPPHSLVAVAMGGAPSGVRLTPSEAAGAPTVLIRGRATFDVRAGMLLAVAGAILGGVLGLSVDAQRDGSLVARALHLPKLTTHTATAVVQPTLPPPAKSVLLPPVEAIVFAAPKTESPAKPPEVKVEASPKPEKEKPTKSARPKWRAAPRYAPAKAAKTDVPKASVEPATQDVPKGPTDANRVLQDAMKDTANTL